MDAIISTTRKHSVCVQEGPLEKLTAAQDEINNEIMWRNDVFLFFFSWKILKRMK